MKIWHHTLPGMLALTTCLWGSATPFSDQIQSGLLTLKPSESETEAVTEHATPLNEEAELSSMGSARFILSFKKHSKTKPILFATPLSILKVVSENHPLNLPLFPLKPTTHLPSQRQFLIAQAEYDHRVISDFAVFPHSEEGSLITTQSLSAHIDTTIAPSYDYDPHLDRQKFEIAKNASHITALKKAMPAMAKHPNLAQKQLSVSLEMDAHKEIAPISAKNEEVSGAELVENWEGPNCAQPHLISHSIVDVFEKTNHSPIASEPHLSCDKFSLHPKSSPLSYNLPLSVVYELTRAAKFDTNPSKEQAFTVSLSNFCDFSPSVVFDRSELTPQIQVALVKAYTQIVADRTFDYGKEHLTNHSNIDFEPVPIQYMRALNELPPLAHVKPQREAANYTLDIHPIEIEMAKVHYAVVLPAPENFQLQPTTFGARTVQIAPAHMPFNTGYSCESFQPKVHVYREIEKTQILSFQAAKERAENLDIARDQYPMMHLSSSPLLWYGPRLDSHIFTTARPTDHIQFDKTSTEFDLMFSARDWSEQLICQYAYEELGLRELESVDAEQEEGELTFDLNTHNFVVFDPDSNQNHTIAFSFEGERAFLKVRLPSPLRLDKVQVSSSQYSPFTADYHAFIDQDILTFNTLAANAADVDFHPLYGIIPFDVQELPKQRDCGDTFQAIANQTYAQVRANPHVLNDIPHITDSPVEALELNRANRDTRQTLYNFSRTSNLDELNTLCMHYDFKSEVAIASKPDGLGYYFSVTLSPYNDEHLTTMPQNIIFVIDNNSFIDRERHKLNQQAILKALHYLTPEDTFNIVFSDKHLYTMSREPVHYTKESEELAFQFLKSQRHRHIDNSIPIWEILASLKNTFKNENQVNSVILLSNGVSIHSKTISGQKRITEKLIAGLGDYSLFTIATGNNNNHRALTHLAELYRGEYITSKSSIALPRLLSRLVRHLNRPLLKRVHVNPIDAPDVKILSHTFHLPDLYPLRPLTIYGSTNSLAPFDLMVQGKVGDQWINIRRSIRPAQAPMEGAKLRRICIALDTDQPHISQM